VSPFDRRGYLKAGASGTRATRSSSERGPWQRSKVVPGTVVSGACWEGSGSAAGCCGSALARAGRSASSREEDDWEGALGAVLFFPPLLLARVGAGGAGFDRGVSQEHGDSARANSSSDPHGDFRFGLISLYQCSTKCPQELEI
jgi:hypothetical protein